MPEGTNDKVHGRVNMAAVPHALLSLRFGRPVLQNTVQLNNENVPYD